MARACSKRRAFAAALLALGLSGAPALAQQPEIAVLQGLDKITARTSRLEAPIGREIAFGALRLTVRACRKRPPEEPPESAVFLEINEVRRGEAVREIFRGWMFASSRAVSALEHPVYDVWVLDCKTASSAPGAR